MEFNEQQVQAIESSAKHLLVLAGAGTGKTRTIIGRAARLIRDGCKPNRIAIITFTRRAAGEIRERLANEIGEARKGIVAGTFHNFCLREMTARRSWFGLEEITVMDADDQSQLMKLVRAVVDEKLLKLIQWARARRCEKGTYSHESVKAGAVLMLVGKFRFPIVFFKLYWLGPTG